MPIIEVEGQEYEFPDSMSDDEIKSVLREKFPAPSQPQETAQPSSNLGEVITDQFDQGMSFGFGDELNSFYGAASDAILGKEKFSKSYDKRQDLQHATLSQQQKDHPYISGASQIAGGVFAGGAAGTAIKGTRAGMRTLDAIRNLSQTQKAHVLGTSGALATSAYTVGEARDMAEAKRNLPNAAGTGYTVGVLAPSVASRADRAVQSVKKLPKSIKKLVTGSADDLPVEQGKAVPLSRGDYLQDGDLQSFESSALRGSHGDGARRVATEFADKQDEVAQAHLRGISGNSLDEIDAVSDAVAMTKQNKATMKQAINKAYDTAKDKAQGVVFRSEAIGEGFAKPVKEIASEFDLGAKGMENAKRIVSQINQLGTVKPGQKITGVKLKALEKLRTRITSAANDAYASGRQSEGALLSKIRATYDGYMEEAIDTAIIRGDDTALNAFKNARGLRKEYGKLYESDKVVKKLLDGDFTPEEVMKQVIGAGQLQAKSNAGRTVKMLIDGAGDKAPQTRQLLKESVMHRVIKKSLGSEVGKSGTNKISFDKLVTNLDGLLKSNKSLAKEVFDADELKLLNEVLEDARLIKSKKPGSVNYSNSMEKLGVIIDKLPLGVGSTLRRTHADKKATKQALKQFSKMSNKEAQKEFHRLYYRPLENKMTGTPFKSISGGSSAVTTD